MSLSVPYHFTTAASTNLQPIGSADQGGSIKGLVICVGTVATPTAYVKFYWTNTQPTVGTTVPGVTIAATANLTQSFPDGITGNGQLWVAVTGAQTDADSTNATAGIQVSVLVE